jgi:flagellin
MAISLATNVDTVTVLKNLDKTQRMLSGNIGRLSSGLRINKAADDAAGLAISETLKAQIRGRTQAQRNSQDGISMIQVAEGALNEVAGALIRLRELAVQSANATNDNTTRSYLHLEFLSLKNEIDRIAKVTDFNGKALISVKTSFTFWVGANAASATNAIKVSMAGAQTKSLGVSGTLNVSSMKVSTLSGAVASMSIIDKAIKDLSSGRAKLGAAQNRLILTVDNLASVRENLMAANSRIRDVDVATESSDYTRNQILQNAGVSVLSQANQLPQVALQLLRG